MSETYEELKGKTVAELREIAKAHEHEALQGYSTMKKAELLAALATALAVAPDAAGEAAPKAAARPAARPAKKGAPPGTDRAALKGRIRELKVERGAALEAHDAERLRRARRLIQRLKRRIRKDAARARHAAPPSTGDSASA